MKQNEEGYPCCALSPRFLPHQAGRETISVGVSGWRDELGEQEAILSCKSVQVHKGKVAVALIENEVKERLVEDTESAELKK